MSAVLLREAATLIRSRAERATPGPWRDGVNDRNKYRALVADAPHPDRENPETGGWAWDDSYGGCLVGESLMKSDRAHIAGMNPTVALTVADWLEVTARDVGTSSLAYHAALAVARTYLGRTP